MLIDLGNILLAFLIICAYMIWFQFMLGWIANQPADALWFLPRVRGGWQAVAWALFLVQFGGPLFLLQMRGIKSDPRWFLPVAGVMLFMQLVYVYYLVIPAFDAPSLLEHWMDFLTPIGVGGHLAGLFSRSFPPPARALRERSQPRIRAAFAAPGRGRHRARTIIRPE